MQRIRAGLFAMLIVSVVVSARADDPPRQTVDQQQKRIDMLLKKLEKDKELTAAERTEMEQFVLVLNKVVDQLDQQGKVAEAFDTASRALDLCRKLYPVQRYPNGHRHLAVTLNNLGGLLQDRGEYGKAQTFYEQALEMFQKVYPASQYPAGHSDVAASLNDLGELLRHRGDYGNAQPYFEQALAMYERLYPAKGYPNGHPDLAQIYNNLGVLMESRGDRVKAEIYIERGLEMRQKLFPASRFPDGNPDLAQSLSNLGGILKARGDLSKAQRCFQEALAMRQKLYPASRYPDGHADLGSSLVEMGELLRARAEYAMAQPYHEQALAMRQRLYPASRYPNGHPELAASLNNIAILLKWRGEYGRALPYYEQTLAMMQKLYPSSHYPSGHPHLAYSLNNLAEFLRARGEHRKALPYFEQALAMFQKLYTTDRYPFGHPDLARSLNNLGFLLHTSGDHARGEQYFEQALIMRQKLYPPSRYSAGHPDLARSLTNTGAVLYYRGETEKSLPHYVQALAMYRKLYPESRFAVGNEELVTALHNLGFILHSHGEFAKAQPYYEEALAMQQKLIERFVVASSEAEAFAYLTTFLRTRDALFSLNQMHAIAVDAMYARLWETRAAISRLMESRHQSLIANHQRPEVKSRWDELTEVRRQLGRLFLNPIANAKEFDSQTRTLTETKERLERELAKLLPILSEHPPRNRFTPADLQRALPTSTAFVDFVRYTNYAFDPMRPGRKGEKLTPQYLAFVLTRDSIQRVQLGNSGDIDSALDDWRRAVADQRPSPAAEVLRRKVWEPIAQQLPASAEKLFLSPDGALSTFPWAALPGDKQDTILLEQYKFAVVPYGSFLLRWLHEEQKHGEQNQDVDTYHSARSLLAVGAVNYDVKPTAPSKDKVPAIRVGATRHWKYLKGAEGELRLLGEIPGLKVRTLSGAAASTSQVLQVIAQYPQVHIATHGFFALDEYLNEQQRVQEQLKDWQFSIQQSTQSVGLGVRNPLSYSGLLLAGANRPQDAGPDGGILSAEALLGQPLENLNLAVLSACQTGLGIRADNECVQGLQKALHVSGCKNVIASLWNVPDDATAALMAVFYDRLIREKKSPLEALREAQLTIYYHPERVPVLAGGERGSGPEFGKTLKMSANVKPLKDGTQRSPVKNWAGFVLSGLGK